jgi:hypothetical protein
MNTITLTQPEVITLEAPPTPPATEPIQAPPKPTLLQALVEAINAHISEEVDKKVSAVLEAHSALKYIDESFKEVINDIAENMAIDKVNDHERDEMHLTRDDISELVDDNVGEAVRVAVRDIDITDQIYDAVNDYDFDDKFDAYDVDDKIEMYLDNNDFPDASRVEEMIIETVEEMLDKKVMEVLKKLLEKMNGI